MRWCLLFLLPLLTGCSSSPFPDFNDPSPFGRATRLAKQGRTGEALVVLQRAKPSALTGPGLIPFFGCGFGRFGGWQRDLRADLLRGPLELAPLLIELEPPPPDPRRLPPRRVTR